MILRYLKTKLGITVLEEKNAILKCKIEYQQKEISAILMGIKEYARTDVDIGTRGNNTIVLTGVFRNRAYVRFYDLDGSEFKQLVEQLRGMKQHSLIRHIDAPSSFKACYDI